MIRLVSCLGLIAACALGGSNAQARAPRGGLQLERVVVVMRHGVRPPTKAQAMPIGVAKAPWPAWGVPPGWLTDHGTIAVATLGASDRSRWTAARLFAAKGCPAAGTVSIIADSDQRTIATADAWAKGFAPGCAIASVHRPQGEDDPLFGPLGNSATLDPASVNVAVSEAIGPGGLSALDRQFAPLLRRLDAILCDTPDAACGVSRTPTTLIDATPVTRPKLAGALDLASTAAQILLLEYADGKPATDVGWGRATRADITALSAFHALEFRLLARPLPVARANLSLIVKRIDNALTAASAPRLTLFSGHDTQIANLGGLLGVHWQIAGYAADDPAPGGQIVVEQLRDAVTRRYVRVLYRAQPLETLAAGDGGEPVQTILRLPGCAAICPMAHFMRILRR